MLSEIAFLGDQVWALESDFTLPTAILSLLLRKHVFQLLPWKRVSIFKSHWCWTSHLAFSWIDILSVCGWIGVNLDNWTGVSGFPGTLPWLTGRRKWLISIWVWHLVLQWIFGPSAACSTDSAFLRSHLVPGQLSLSRLVDIPSLHPLLPPIPRIYSNYYVSYLTFLNMLNM